MPIRSSLNFRGARTSRSRMPAARRMCPYIAFPQQAEQFFEPPGADLHRKLIRSRRLSEHGTRSDQRTGRAHDRPVRHRYCIFMLALLWVSSSSLLPCDGRARKHRASGRSVKPRLLRLQLRRLSRHRFRKLEGIDETQAACVMAIVSHETGIPLDELVFKSIKAV